MRMVINWSLVAVATLSGCAAATTSYRSAYAFRCGSVSHYGLGTLIVARWIRHDRTVAATVLRWLPQMPAGSPTHMEVQWSARPSEELDLGRGTLTITHRLLGLNVVDRPSRWFIELSSNAAGEGGARVIRGWINTRKSTHAIQLTADWSRVQKLAGGKGLYLLVHDGSGAIVDSVTLSAKLFWEAPSRAERLREWQSGPEPELLLDDGCERDSSPAHR